MKRGLLQNGNRETLDRFAQAWPPPPPPPPPRGGIHHRWVSGTMQFAVKSGRELNTLADGHGGSSGREE